MHFNLLQNDRPELPGARSVRNSLKIKVSSFDRVLRIDHFRNLPNSGANPGRKTGVTGKRRLNSLIIKGRKGGQSGRLWGARLVVTKFLGHQYAKTSQEGCGVRASL